MIRENTTRKSPLVLMVALGEGCHSWHRAFAWGCAALELRLCQQWNLTELYVDVCATIGLGTGRKRSTGCLALSRRK